MPKERHSASLCAVMAALALGGCNSTNVTTQTFFPPVTKQLMVTARLRSVLQVLDPSSKCMSKLPPDRTELKAGETWKGQIEPNIFASCLHENARFILHFNGRHGHSATGTWERPTSTGTWELKKVQFGVCIVPNNGNVLDVDVVSAKRRC